MFSCILIKYNFHIFLSRKLEVVWPKQLHIQVLTRVFAYRKPHCWLEVIRYPKCP